MRALAILCLLVGSATADNQQTAIDQTRAWFAALHDHKVEAAIALMAPPAYVGICDPKAKQPLAKDGVKKQLDCELKRWESPFRKPSWKADAVKVEVTTIEKITAAKADRAGEQYLASLKDHVLLHASVRDGTGISYSAYNWYFAVDAKGKIDAVVASWIKIVN